MNRFHHLLLFIFSLLLFTPPAAHAVQREYFSVQSTGNRKALIHPSAKAPIARDFASEKRRVPTGSNPLHNKR
ncbi:hypothetical protein LguiA_035289 [Lonicera macranthoides]